MASCEPMLINVTGTPSMSWTPALLEGVVARYGEVLDLEVPSQPASVPGRCPSGIAGMLVQECIDAAVSSGLPVAVLLDASDAFAEDLAAALERRGVLCLCVPSDTDWATARRVSLASICPFLPAAYPAGERSEKTGARAAL